MANSCESSLHGLPKREIAKMVLLQAWCGNGKLDVDVICQGAARAARFLAFRS